jgi:two-component system chemotaxis response regulator CheY
MQALVVDDSRAMRAILTRLMTGLGFDVVQAPDGAEALELLDGGLRPDVALVDWNMPVMDGLSFVQAARAEGFSDLPIIMITTEGSLEYVTRAMEAGANEYLMKPFTKESLHDKLVLLGFDTPA